MKHSRSIPFGLASAAALALALSACGGGDGGGGAALPFLPVAPAPAASAPPPAPTDEVPATPTEPVAEVDDSFDEYYNVCRGTNPKCYNDWAPSPPRPTAC